jgi:type II secretory pathway pseudopilin PulG
LLTDQSQRHTAIFAGAFGLPLNDFISSTGVATFVQIGEITMTVNPYESPEPTPLAVNAVKQRRFSLLEIIVVCSIMAVLFALIMPAIQNAKHGSPRTLCINNLWNITLSLLNYAENHNAFPPAYTVDADGNRLHSWRTLLLPYLDQQELYASIDFSKPWNDPVNARAFNTQLEIFLVLQQSCRRDSRPILVTRRLMDALRGLVHDHYLKSPIHTTRRFSLPKLLQAMPFTGCLRKTQMRTSC